jgi:hypothetical protein
MRCDETQEGNMSNTKRHCTNRKNQQQQQLPEDVVSSKLNMLSLEERSHIEHEMHGIVNLEDETGEPLEIKLNDMNRALSELTTPKNSSTKDNNNTGGGGDGEEQEQAVVETSAAYEKALTMSEEYVEGLKVGFLRAAYYNSQEAASRLVYFFHFKRRLFGDEKLVRDIHFSDLNEDDLTGLKLGLVQLLPHRDRAGRGVILVYGKINETVDTDTALRALSYVTMMAFRKDVETQKRGFVLIYYGFGQSSAIPGRPKEWLNYWRSIPIRIVACHLCGEEHVLEPPAREFYKAAEGSVAFRCRRHFGMYDTYI